jgi:hypothetical protein
MDHLDSRRHPRQESPVVLPAAIFAAHAPNWDRRILCLSLPGSSSGNRAGGQRWEYRERAPQRYALSNTDGEVTVRNVADDQVLRRFVVVPCAGPNQGIWLHFSPGDRCLTAYYVDSVTRPTFVWDLEDPRGRPFLAVSPATPRPSAHLSRPSASSRTRSTGHAGGSSSR